MKRFGAKYFPHMHAGMSMLWFDFSIILQMAGHIAIAQYKGLVWLATDRDRVPHNFSKLLAGLSGLVHTLYYSVGCAC